MQRQRSHRWVYVWLIERYVELGGKRMRRSTIIHLICENVEDLIVLSARGYRSVVFATVLLPLWKWSRMTMRMTIWRLRWMWWQPTPGRNVRWWITSITHTIRTPPKRSQKNLHRITSSSYWWKCPLVNNVFPLSLLEISSQAPSRNTLSHSKSRSGCTSTIKDSQAHAWLSRLLFVRWVAALQEILGSVKIRPD